MTDPNSKYRIVLLWVVSSLCTVPVQAWQEPGGEPIEVTVDEPTRMDWTFTLNRKSYPKPPAEWTQDYPETATYQLYIPASCDPDVKSGLILFVSPSPRAMGVVSRWKAVCDETGCILAAPHGAGNECGTPVRTQLVLAALDDVRRKYKIDADRTYISGFSGGGRMACRIGFSLPEYFGGVMPIGSGGELRPDESWLKKRVADRLGVAFMIGSDDFNFCEIMTIRAPLLEAANVRTRTWVIDGMGHAIPESPALIEAVRWLDETVDERRQLAEKYPSTRIDGNQDPPAREAQAAAIYDDALEMMKSGEGRFAGQMMLKGIIMRWLDTDQAVAAGEALKKDLGWKQDEVRERLEYAIHRCRGLDRFATEEKHEMYLSQRIPRTQRAILDWTTIIRNGAPPEIISEARERIEVLTANLKELEAAEPDAADSGAADK